MSGTKSGVQFSTNGADTDMTIYRGKSLAVEVIWGGAEPIDITGYLACLLLRNAAVTERTAAAQGAFAFRAVTSEDQPEATRSDLSS